MNLLGPRKLACDNVLLAQLEVAPPLHDGGHRFDPYRGHIVYPKGKFTGNAKPYLRSPPTGWTLTGMWMNGLVTSLIHWVVRQCGFEPHRAHKL